MEWFVEMPDGKLRAGYAWQDFTSLKGPVWVNLPPEDGETITKEEFDRRASEQRKV